MPKRQMNGLTRTAAVSATGTGKNTPIKSTTAKGARGQELKIVTEHTYPPIPIRSFDWHAWIDGFEEDGMYGSGRTEEEAIEDLIKGYGDTFCHGCNSQIFAEDCTRSPGEDVLVCPCGSDHLESIKCD